MKKPELLVTPKAVADIEPLAKAGADAVMIGEQKFGLRLAGEFSREDVKQAVKIAHENGVKVYVAMNAMFHNDKVEELTDYVAFLNGSTCRCNCFRRSSSINGGSRSSAKYAIALEYRNNSNKLVYL